MKKLLIFIIIVIVVLFVLFWGGDDAGEVVLPDGAPDTSSSNATATPSNSDDDANVSPTASVDKIKDDSTADDDTSINDSPSDENGVLRNAQTYTNNAYGYTISLHEWWWYSHYGDVDDEKVASLIAFDRNKLDNRPYADAAIVLEHRTDSNVTSSNDVLVKKDGNQTYVLRYQYKNEDYRKIFQAMAESMKFTE